jgi:hypothetical protein
MFQPYLLHLLSVLIVLGVHGTASQSLLVLEACFSLLAMFYALFYLLRVFLHDRRQRPVRGRRSAEL